MGGIDCLVEVWKMFLYWIIAILMAAGVLLFLWCLWGWFLLPLNDDAVQLVLNARENADDLERQLRALCWLRGSSLLRGKIVIVDDGLSETGRDLVQHLRLKYGLD